MQARKILIIKIKTKVKIILAFTRRLIFFLYDFLLVVFYSIYNVLTKGVLFDDNIVFITAAEKNYYEQTKNLINSFEKNLDNRLIFFDIGLEDVQKKELTINYPKLEIRKFNFSEHPDFISKYIGNKLGSYAWKPIIIDEVLNETRSKVVWLDAGNIINRKIIFLKIALTAKKLVVPASSNSIKDWTHNKTIEYIGLNSKNLKSNNYASGLIGFNYSSEITLTISQEWKKFSSIKDCIAPIGSSRDNHRQDQAVLTLLLYKYLFTNKLIKFTYLRTNFICGVLFHKKRLIDF